MSRSIALFLMNQKGYAVLNALAEKRSEVVELVVGARDSNMQRDYYDEIKGLCEELAIVFFDRTQPCRVNSPYALAIGWRWLLALPETQLIIFHDSLLPKYRGFNPLVTALLNGDDRIGVTALFAAGEYDTGDIIAQASSSISYPIKIQQATDIISGNYAELALVVSGMIEKESLRGEQQDNRCATYSLWRDDEDYRIDWSQSAEFIKRFVDAVGFPYKGAATLFDNRLARVLDVEIMDDILIENRTPGKVIFIQDSKPVVVCGRGLVKITAMINEHTGESFLPLPKFRVRFE
jgi:methionyl-tRNA formyltransferase